MFVLPVLVMEHKDLLPFLEAFREHTKCDVELKITDIRPRKSEATGQWTLEIDTAPLTQKRN